MKLNYLIRREFVELHPFLDEIRVQADSDRNSLGFLPEPAYAEAARQRKIILLLAQDGNATSYVGHLLFGGIFPILRVRQITIAPAYRRSPSQIWRKWRDCVGISKEEFEAYFQSCDVAHALGLNDVMLMENALPLPQLRKLVRGFQPPQFYYRLNGAREKMGLANRRHVRVRPKRVP
jgi:hypothetical protein